MSLFDTRNDLRSVVEKLPKKYTDYTIDELMNEYCAAIDSNNTANKNLFISAILLRFWYEIDRIYQKINTFGYDYDDAFNKLYEAVNIACEYRAWQKPEKATNAQACLNQVIRNRAIGASQYDAQLQKNTRPDCILDAPISDVGEGTFGDMIEDESPWRDGSYDIIQALIKNNNIVEAMIADTIANNDVFKHTHKTIKRESDDEEETPSRYVEHYIEFWPFKVVQTLNSLDDRYITYFTRKYTVNEIKAKEAFTDIQAAPNQKKYRFIKGCISSMRQIVEGV